MAGAAFYTQDKGWQQPAPTMGGIPMKEVPPVSEVRALDYRMVNFLLAAIGGAISVYVATAVPPPHVAGAPAPIAIPLSPSPSAAVVYITGAVRHPGVYRLRDACRLYAAIQAAGGLTDDADRRTLNLARRVHDEEMVVVPSRTASATPQAGPPAPLDVNLAGVPELTAAGLSPAQATAMVAWRGEHGPIHDAQDLKRIHGVSRRWRHVAQLLGLPTVDDPEKRPPDFQK